MLKCHLFKEEFSSQSAGMRFYLLSSARERVPQERRRGCFPVAFRVLPMMEGGPLNNTLKERELSSGFPPFILPAAALFNVLGVLTNSASAVSVRRRLKLNALCYYLLYMDCLSCGATCLLLAPTMTMLAILDPVRPLCALLQAIPATSGFLSCALTAAISVNRYLRLRRNHRETTLDVERQKALTRKIFLSTLVFFLALFTVLISLGGPNGVAVRVCRGDRGGNPSISALIPLMAMFSLAFGALIMDVLNVRRIA